MRVNRSYWRKSAFKKSGSVKIKTIFLRGWWKKENKRCWRSWNCRQVDHSNESHTSTSQENRTYVFKRNATKATILNIWIKSIPHCLLFAYSIGFYSESCKQLIVNIELIIEWSFTFLHIFLTGWSDYIWLTAFAQTILSNQQPQPKLNQ